MTEVPDNESANGRRMMWIMFAGLAVAAVGGAIFGFFGAHGEAGGGALTAKAIAIVAAMGAALAVLIYSIWRNARKIDLSGDPLTRREKLNRNIMILCGLIGGGIGIALATTGDASIENLSNLVLSGNDTPLAVPLALGIAIVWGVIMPVVAWFWHRNAVDEQEAAAYRDGGYYAAYAFIIVTPVWWILWRGGLLPEPDGVAIFLMFNFLWLGVWFWKKYR